MAEPKKKRRIDEAEADDVALNSSNQLMHDQQQCDNEEDDTSAKHGTLT